MFAIISPLILRGVIDNTLEDLIDLRLWCADGEEPIHYRLRGNCLRDIAGCRVEFDNKGETRTDPPDRERTVLSLLREAASDVVAGDITLSLRVPDHRREGIALYFSLFRKKYDVFFRRREEAEKRFRALFFKFFVAVGINDVPAPRARLAREHEVFPFGQ